MPTFRELCGKPYAPCTTSRIVAFICLNPGSSLMDISNKLNMKSRDVNKVIKKLLEKNHLGRRANEGPRGGYGYYPKAL